MKTRKIDLDKLSSKILSKQGKTHKKNRIPKFVKKVMKVVQEQFRIRISLVAVQEQFRSSSGAVQEQFRSGSGAVQEKVHFRSRLEAVQDQEQLIKSKTCRSKYSIMKTIIEIVFPKAASEDTST